VLAVPISWQKGSILGGAPIRTIEVYKRIADKGHNVYIIESTPFSSEMMGVYEPSFNSIRIKIPQANSTFFRVVINPLLWIIKATYVIRKIPKVDIIVSSGNDFSNIFLAYLASIIHRKPWVVVFHDIFYRSSIKGMLQLLRLRGSSLVDSLFISIVAKFTLILVKRCSAILCVSRTVRSLLIKCDVSPEKLWITGNGVNIYEIQATKPINEKFDCVFMGRIERAKGVNALLKAWIKIIKEYQENVSLLIIGDGTYLEHAKKIVVKNNIEKNVRFTGFLVGKEKYRYLKSARLFVYPSEGFEGWGLVVAEALACGLPVIAYEHPVLKEIFSDCQSVIFVQHNIDALVSKIKELLADSEALDQLKKKALDCAKKFDWEAISDKELSILEFIVKLHNMG